VNRIPSASAEGQRGVERHRDEGPDPVELVHRECVADDAEERDAARHERDRLRGFDPPRPLRMQEERGRGQDERDRRIGRDPVRRVPGTAVELAAEQQPVDAEVGSRPEVEQARGADDAHESRERERDGPARAVLEREEREAREQERDRGDRVHGDESRNDRLEPGEVPLPADQREEAADQAEGGGQVGQAPDGLEIGGLLRGFRRGHGTPTRRTRASKRGSPCRGSSPGSTFM
jgi:hypothetical protein